VPIQWTLFCSRTISKPCWPGIPTSWQRQLQSGSISAPRSSIVCHRYQAQQKQTDLRATRNHWWREDLFLASSNLVFSGKFKGYVQAVLKSLALQGKLNLPTMFQADIICSYTACTSYRLRTNFPWPKKSWEACYACQQHLLSPRYQTAPYRNASLYFLDVYDGKFSCRAISAVMDHLIWFLGLLHPLGWHRIQHIRDREHYRNEVPRKLWNIQANPYRRPGHQNPFLRTIFYLEPWGISTFASYAGSFWLSVGLSYWWRGKWAERYWGHEYSPAAFVRGGWWKGWWWGEWKGWQGGGWRGWWRGWG